MNTTRTRASKHQTTISLLTELIEETIKQNYNERLKDHQKEIDLLRGNHTELLKRVRAMEEYLKVEFISQTKYVKCQPQQQERAYKKVKTLKTT